MHGAHIYCIFIAYSHTCARGSRLTSNLIESAAWLGPHSRIVVRSLALCSLLCVYSSRARSHPTQHNTTHSMNFFLHTLLRLNHTDCKQLTFNSGIERTYTNISFSLMCYDFRFFFGNNSTQIANPRTVRTAIRVCLAAVTFFSNSVFLKQL